MTSTLLPIFLDAALKSVLVLILAGLAVACMRRSSAAARHLVLFLATASLLALPLLSWSLPGWHVLPQWAELRQPPGVDGEALQRTFATQESGAFVRSVLSDQSIPINEFPEPPAPRLETTEARSTPVTPITPLPPQPQRAESSFRALSPWQWALLAWLAGAALALVPTTLGLASLWRLELTSRRETEPGWLLLLRWLTTRLNLHRRVALLKSARRRMPMTWGVLRPKLLLPEESQEWPEERRRVVLLHELAHAKRWDYLTNLVTQLVCAVYWFNPLVWLAARQMVAERERACDDLVLRHGAKPADYAEQVLQIAAGLPLGRFAAYGGIAMARPSRLEGRLRAILDGKRNRAALTRFVVFIAVVLLAVVVIPVAMMRAAAPLTNTAQSDPSSSRREEAQTSNPQSSQSLVTSAATVENAELRRSIRYSQLVVVGEVVSNSGTASRTNADDGTIEFRITETLKGTAPAVREISPVLFDSKSLEPARQEIIRRSRAQADLKVGDHLVLFLTQWNDGSLNWHGANVYHSLQPASPAMVSTVKRLIASPDPDSGAVQLAAAMRKFLPGYSFREVQATGAVTRLPTWVLTSPAGSNEVISLNPDYGQNPKLIELLTRWPIRVSTSQDAEDLGRLVFGLSHGETWLDDRKVSAVTNATGWVVTHAYVGLGQVQGDPRGPVGLRLILEDGVLKDLRRYTGSIPAGAPTGAQAPDPASDGTYRFWLTNSELVVVGNITTIVVGNTTTNQIALFWGGSISFEFKVAEVFKGGVATGESIKVSLSRPYRTMPGDGGQIFKQDDELILFLKRVGSGDTASWQWADMVYGGRRYDAQLASALWRLVGAMPESASAKQIELGPESGGLRLGLVVTPNPDPAKEGYNVELRLLNVTTNLMILLDSGWESDSDLGDFKKYLEAALSIETDPEIAPWLGQVFRGPNRRRSQPEYMLKPGEDLTLNWSAPGRRLKNVVSDPLTVHNPEFPTDGLYSVHASISLNTSAGAVRLTSNEQKVPVGGSRVPPKHPYGKLVGVDAEAGTARLGLGAAQRIAPGDQFQIRTSMIDAWKLTITNVEMSSSQGRLELLPRTTTEPGLRSDRIPPRVGEAATFIPPQNKTPTTNAPPAGTRTNAATGNPQSSQSLVTSAATVENARTNQAHQVFGPVLEREMKQPDGFGPGFLDLETGAFVTNTPPGDVTLLGAESDMRVRHGLNMAAVSVASNRWDVSAEEVVKEMANQTNQAQVRLGGPESRRTWFFKTREGTLGVLQILPEEVGAVRLRWKLVKPASDPRSSRREEAQTSNPQSSQSLVTSAATESPSTNVLRSRIVFERTVFKQGEPIEAKVLVKNVSGQPVRYDLRDVEEAHLVAQRFQVLGPDGNPVPLVALFAQYNVRPPGRYEFPTIEAGQEIVVDTARLDRPDYYMGRPGRYQVNWLGTTVGPQDPPRVRELRNADEWNRALREAQTLAAGLPPAASVGIEVVPAPGGGPDGDLVGRVLENLPPGWRINGADILAASVQPEGWQSGRGSGLLLVRENRLIDSNPWLNLFITTDRLVENPTATVGMTELAQYLGKGPFGHVYVARGRDQVLPGTIRLDHNPLTCWSHALHDLAVSLEVTEPAPKKPVGPDWGLMVNQILNGAIEGQPSRPLGAFCAKAELSTGENGKPRIRYESNFVPADQAKPPGRKDAATPYYFVSLSVAPTNSPGQGQVTEADKSIQWDGTAPVRSYRVKRLGVDIMIEVRSDEPEFVKRLNAILDREISAVLGSPALTASVPPATIAPDLQRTNVFRMPPGTNGMSLQAVPRLSSVTPDGLLELRAEFATDTDGGLFAVQFQFINKSATDSLLMSWHPPTLANPFPEIVAMHRTNGTRGSGTRLSGGSAGGQSHTVPRGQMPPPDIEVIIPPQGTHFILAPLKPQMLGELEPDQEIWAYQVRINGLFKYGLVNDSRTNAPPFYLSSGPMKLTGKALEGDVEAKFKAYLQRKESKAGAALPAQDNASPSTDTAPGNPRSAMASPARTNPQSSQSLVTSAATSLTGGVAALFLLTAS